ncbi:GPI-N-acetylgalactosamine transferase PGAP4-like [Lissotriton helveticus]
MILRPYQRRWYCSNRAVQSVVLIVLTFLVLGPTMCHRLLYSYYYCSSCHLDHMTQQFLLQNLNDGEAAVNYFTHLIPPITQKSALTLDGKASAKVMLVITIITVRREPEYHYFMQVASKVHRLLLECGHACSDYLMFICNVDPDPRRHVDAKLLEKIFPTTQRHGSTPRNESVNEFQNEKQDYTYCLDRTLSTFDPEYVLLLEDDAVPEEDIFRVINHLFLTRFPKKPLGGALYIKLYHPERFQHYLSPVPMRLIEWLGFGMFAGAALSSLYAWTTGQLSPHFCTFLFFALYSMVLVEMVGRHYLLELRRWSPALYNLGPATECCTQAMLFSAASAERVLVHLTKIYCMYGFGKDKALYFALSQMWEEKAYVVEPNLVQHVGLFSRLPRGHMYSKQP